MLQRVSVFPFSQHYTSKLNTVIVLYCGEFCEIYLPVLGQPRDLSHERRICYPLNYKGHSSSQGLIGSLVLRPAQNSEGTARLSAPPSAPEQRKLTPTHGHTTAWQRAEFAIQIIIPFSPLFFFPSHPFEHVATLVKDNSLWNTATI